MIAGATGSLAAFGALAWLGDHRRLPGELSVQHDLARFVNSHAWSGDTTAFFIGLGAAPIAVLTVLAVALVVRREIGEPAAALVPAAAAVALFARAIEELLGGDLPSGHAAYVAATFGLGGYLALMRGRRDLAALAATVIVAVGPSLLARGAHTAVSIAAGYALGIAWLLTLLLAADRVRPEGGHDAP